LDQLEILNGLTSLQGNCRFLQVVGSVYRGRTFADLGFDLGLRTAPLSHRNLLLKETV
jgi:hypothetical protein